MIEQALFQESAGRGKTLAFAVVAALIAQACTADGFKQPCVVVLSNNAVVSEQTAKIINEQLQALECPAYAFVATEGPYRDDQAKISRLSREHGGRGPAVVVGTPGKIAQCAGFFERDRPIFSLDDVVLAVIDEVDTMLNRKLGEQVMEIFSLMNFPTIAGFSGTLTEDTILAFSTLATKHGKKDTPVNTHFKRVEDLIHKGIQVRDIFMDPTNLDQVAVAITDLMDNYMPRDARLLVQVGRNKEAAHLALLLSGIDFKRDQHRQDVVPEGAEIWARLYPSSGGCNFTLADALRGAVGMFHGDLPPAVKSQVLANFSSDKLRVLVATGLERGFNDEGLHFTIIVGMPSDRENAVHAASRGGRGGKGAITIFLTPEGCPKRADFAASYSCPLQELDPSLFENVWATRARIHPSFLADHAAGFAPEQDESALRPQQAVLYVGPMCEKPAGTCACKRIHVGENADGLTFHRIGFKTTSGCKERNSRCTCGGYHHVFIKEPTEFVEAYATTCTLAHCTCPLHSLIDYDESLSDGGLSLLSGARASGGCGGGARASGSTASAHGGDGSASLRGGGASASACGDGSAEDGFMAAPTRRRGGGGGGGGGGGAAAAPADFNKRVTESGSRFKAILCEKEGCSKCPKYDHLVSKGGQMGILAPNGASWLPYCTIPNCGGYTESGDLHLGFYHRCNAERQITSEGPDARLICPESCPGNEAIEGLHYKAMCPGIHKKASLSPPPSGADKDDW